MNIDENNQVDIYRAIKTLIINYKIIIICIIFMILSSGIWLLFQNKKYTATATILPSYEGQNSDLGQLAGFANTFGLGGNKAGSQADLYEDIIKSRSFSSRLISKKLFDPKSNSDKSLAVFFNLSKTYDSLASSKEGNMEFKNSTKEFHESKNLATIISNSMHIKKNINDVITFSIDASHPSIASQFLNLIIIELKSFNKDNRILKATEERKFIQERLSEVSLILKNAEDDLTTFSMKNAELSSPNLQQKKKILERTVRLNEELYLMLFKQLEMAKIQEEKDRPIFQILDRAYAPEKPTSPKIYIILCANIFLGFCVGAIIIYLFSVLSSNFVFLKKLVKSADGC